MAFIPGTEVRVKDIGNDPAIDRWSSYHGYFGTVVNTVDEQYGLVYLPKKVLEGRNPMAVVPWCQLDVVLPDLSSVVMVMSGKFKMETDVGAMVKCGLEIEPRVLRGVQGFCAAMLTEAFSEFEKRIKKVDTLILHPSLYEAFNGHRSTVRNGPVGTIWGANVAVSEKMPEDEFLLASGDETIRWKIQKES